MISLPIGQYEWFALGGLCLILPVWFIIGILLCVWVYRDAESRGMSGPLWLIIVLITCIIGLIIYLIVRGDRKPAQPSSTASSTVSRFCPNCGRSIPPEVKFCPHCGKALD